MKTKKEATYPDLLRIMDLVDQAPQILATAKNPDQILKRLKRVRLIYKPPRRPINLPEDPMEALDVISRRKHILIPCCIDERKQTLWVTFGLKWRKMLEDLNAERDLNTFTY